MFEHDLFGKTGTPFPDHALAHSRRDIEPNAQLLCADAGEGTERHVKPRGVADVNRSPLAPFGCTLQKAGLMSRDREAVAARLKAAIARQLAGEMRKQGITKPRRGDLFLGVAVARFSVFE